ncbi:hypothetical protein [Sulfurimonas sp.]
MNIIKEFAIHCVDKKRGLTEVHNQLEFCAENSITHIELAREVMYLIHGEEAEEIMTKIDDELHELIKVKKTI